jgi:hypothetical protein
MDHRHRVSRVRCAPKPRNRGRRLTFCADFYGNVQELLGFFKRSMKMEGEAYFMLDHDRAEDNQERAALNKNYYNSVDECMNLPLHEMYPAKTCLKIEQHEKFRLTHQGQSGSFICDAEHSPKFSTPGLATPNPYLFCSSIVIGSCTKCIVFQPQ